MKTSNIKNLFEINNFNYKEDESKILKICEITKTRVDSNKKNIKEHYGIEQSFIIHYLAKKFNTESFFEIGTGRGTASYSVALCDTIKRIDTFDIVPFERKFKTAVNFKPFFGSNKDLYNLIPFESKKKIKFSHINELNEKYNVENKNKYDMAFIDGNHSNYNIIMNDFINSNNVVKDNGIIVFDDYGNFPVVTKVVDDIIKKHPEYSYLYVPFRGYLYMPDKKDEKSGEVILFKNPYDIKKILKP